MSNKLPVIGQKLIVKSFFLWKMIRAITHEVEHVERRSQVVTYSTICIEHIQHNNDDVISMEVTMTSQNFQKLLNSGN